MINFSIFEKHNSNSMELQNYVIIECETRYKLNCIPFACFYYHEFMTLTERQQPCLPQKGKE